MVHVEKISMNYVIIEPFLLDDIFRILEENRSSKQKIDLGSVKEKWLQMICKLF